MDMSEHFCQNCGVAFTPCQGGASSTHCATCTPMSFPQGTEADVCADIASRQKMGFAKYGTTVSDNPLELRQWFQHAYEEALDLAIYLKRSIQELNALIEEDESANSSQ